MKLHISFKGGQGSGHFGHSGRPGLVGGSQEGTGTRIEFYDSNYPDEELENMGDPYSVAAEAGLYIGGGKDPEYVAIRDDRIVGASFTSFYIDQSTNEAEYSFDVAVLPDYQNKGIGTELINRTIEAFRELQNEIHPSTIMRVDVRSPYALKILLRLGAVIESEHGDSTIVIMKQKK